METIESERLFLRRLTLEDSEFILELQIQTDLLNISATET